MAPPSERIKKIRKKYKLSQAQFADLVGVERTYVSKIETGKANPSKQLIKVICKEFKIREEWLLDGNPLIGECEGLTDQEIEDFELNTAEISTRGLFNTLNLWSEVLLYMSETLFEFSIAYAKIGKPDETLLQAKAEFESILAGLQPHLDSLFRRLSSQEPRKFKSHEEIMAKLREGRQKYAKDE